MKGTLHDANYLIRHRRSKDRSGDLTIRILDFAGQTVDIINIDFNKNTPTIKVRGRGRDTLLCRLWMFKKLPKIRRPTEITFKELINGYGIGKIFPGGELRIGCESVTAEDITKIYEASQRRIRLEAQDGKAANKKVKT